MDHQQQVQEVQNDIEDGKEVPPQYRPDGPSSSGSRDGRPVRKKHANDNSNVRTERPAVSSQGAKRKTEHTTPRAVRAETSPGFISTLRNTISFLSPNRQQQVEASASTEHQIDDIEEPGLHHEQERNSHKYAVELELQFQNILDNKEYEWSAREQDLQRQLSQLHQHAAARDHDYQAQLQNIQSEKVALEMKHNAFIRKHPEASFKQMESARWLPEDDTKVMGDLDRLKREMRTWSKAAAIKNTASLKVLVGAEHGVLMQKLEKVAVLENGDLPQSLVTTAKSSMLLLNALLAEDVYANFFRSPFFFLGHNINDNPANNVSEQVLMDIYRQAQSANQQESHIWRSQTLRMLMPPLRNDITDDEKALRHTTEEAIARAANQRASEFLSSPASFLIENSEHPDILSKLKSLYKEAASHSYKLWTRRTEMKYYSLSDIKKLAFDAESPYFEADALMHYEDHEDQLKGVPVTMLVHPLLKVCGTDEGKDYDQERVWAKGVVWLDSK